MKNKSRNNLEFILKDMQTLKKTRWVSCQTNQYSNIQPSSLRTLAHSNDSYYTYTSPHKVHIAHCNHTNEQVRTSGWVRNKSKRIRTSDKNPEQKWLFGWSLTHNDHGELCDWLSCHFILNTIIVCVPIIFGLKTFSFYNILCVLDYRHNNIMVMKTHYFHNESMNYNTAGWIGEPQSGAASVWWRKV